MAGNYEYRWERRRRLNEARSAALISSLDYVILAVAMAMLVLVLRSVLLFGVSQGMQVGNLPVTPHIDEMDLPYAGSSALMDSFDVLTAISMCLILFWGVRFWSVARHRPARFGAIAFQLVLGLLVFGLLVGSPLPRYAHIVI